MPSARLVFNDDATVLGPVLERTGEMIKAATSDIPRLRLGQEAMALDNRRFAHRQSMDLANLKMRQDAFQAEQDNALMENLFGPGAASGTRSRAATGAGGTSTADGRLALAEDKQYETEYSSRAKRIQQALDAERAALPKHSGLTQDPTTLKWSEIPLTPEEVKQREKTARHNVGKRFITETDMDPITARVLHDMGFSINVPTQPGRQGAPVDGSLLSLSGGPAASALDLQRKRAAFVRLKGDPALQQRMGIDEYRLNELYQQLWPEAQGAPEAAPAAGVELPPLTIQAEGALEAPAPTMPRAPFTARPPAEVSEEAVSEPEAAEAIGRLVRAIQTVMANIQYADANGLNTEGERAKLRELTQTARAVPPALRGPVDQALAAPVPTGEVGILYDDRRALPAAPPPVAPAPFQFPSIDNPDAERIVDEQFLKLQQPPARVDLLTRMQTLQQRPPVAAGVGLPWRDRGPQFRGQ